MKVIFALTALVAVVSSAPQRLPAYGYGPDYAPGHGYRGDNYYEPALYNFDWAVNNDFGNNYGQRESRDGPHTEGEYYVDLPDGRLQRVTYTVSGDSGFLADVSYVGEPQYPTTYGQGNRYYNHHNRPGAYNPDRYYA